MADLKVEIDVRVIWRIASLQCYAIKALQLLLRRRMTAGIRIIRIGRGTRPVRFLALVVPSRFASQVPE